MGVCLGEKGKMEKGNEGMRMNVSLSLGWSIVRGVPCGTSPVTEAAVRHGDLSMYLEHVYMLAAGWREGGVRGADPGLGAGAKPRSKYVSSSWRLTTRVIVCGAVSNGRHLPSRGEGQVKVCTSVGADSARRCFCPPP